MAELREPPFGHESPGVNTPRVLGIVGILGVMVVVAVVSIYLALTFWIMPEHAQLESRPAILPPAPRLQPHPKTDLDELRAQKGALLLGYAWTDKTRDFARIPIQRSMQIYAQEQSAGSRESNASVNNVPSAASTGGRPL